MKKKILVLFLLIVGVFSLITAFGFKSKADEADVEELKALLTKYYNDGYYIKDSVINVNETVQNELSLFHAKANDLVRTTNYNGDELWFNTGSGYGTSQDGKLTQFKMVDGVKTNEVVVSSLPGMEEYYCTLNDFIVGSHNSAHSNNVELNLLNGWTVSNGVYSNTTSEVLDAFRLFTAPLWLGKTSDNKNYIDYKLATIEVVGEELVMKLWVSATEVEGKLASGVEANETHAVFSKATVKLPVSVWDGTSVSEGLVGEGSEANPYLIQSAADFVYFKEIATTLTGKYVKLMANIDLNENALMIHSFGGTLDGNGKTIFGLDNNGDAIGWPGEGDTKGAGLFHILESTGTIKNLTLKGFVQSWTTTAGFVGISYGVIENCVNYANVDCKYASAGFAAIAESGSIINCVNYGNMTGGYENNAGIVGVSRATITGCTNYGNIDSPNNGTKIGGIAGFAQYAITDCVNYGTITATGGAIGGIVGEVQGTVENCVNNAEATVSGGGWSVGGIVGHSAGNVISCKNYASVTGTGGGVAGIVGELVRDKNTKAENCENHGVVTGKQYTGGIVGYLRNNSVINCVNKGEVTASGTKIGGIAGGSDVTGAYVTGCENHANIKGGQHTAGIIGQIQGSIMNCTNYGNITSTSSESSSIFGKLWVPAETPATVENCENYGNVKISGWAGGLFGNAANVTIKNCVNKGNLEATSGSVGGIIGYVFAGATITDCENYGKITAPTNVCGVAFHVNGTLTNCDNYGELVVTNADGVIQPIYIQIAASGSVNNCNDKRN